MIASSDIRKVDAASIQPNQLLLTVGKLQMCSRHLNNDIHLLQTGNVCSFHKSVLPPNEGASPPALLVEKAQYEQNHSLQPYVA